MARFGKKDTWMERAASAPVLLVLGLLIVLAAWALWERVVVEREMAARRATIEAKRSEILARQTELESRVLYLEDKRGVEAEIRQHFDVAREGEKVIILTGEPHRPITTTTTVATTTAPTTWLQWMGGLFSSGE